MDALNIPLLNEMRNAVFINGVTDSGEDVDLGNEGKHGRI